MADVGATYRKLIGKPTAERDTLRQTEDWATLNWRKLEANAGALWARLQRRIYQAKRGGDMRRVHNLQRLLLRSFSARCLAVRRVTQDNRGKKTAGIDGVKDISPPTRITYVYLLRNLRHTARPVRRVYIPKPNQATEKRPLGIPTMLDRALGAPDQALVKLALEPEWEALFAANSYRFRPGRSCHDAIEAIFNHICRQPKYVLDADIEKGFDRINHEALLTKIDTIQPVMCLLRAWLKAGVIEAGRFFESEAGTPQGGVISPLLANIALHEMETRLSHCFPTATLVRYADDFVILCVSEQTLLEAQAAIEQLNKRRASFSRFMNATNSPTSTRIQKPLSHHLMSQSLMCGTAMFSIGHAKNFDTVSLAISRTEPTTNGMISNHPLCRYRVMVRWDV